MVSTIPRTTNTARRFFGTRRDWRLEPPRLPHPPRPGLHWIGVLAVIVSVLIGWPAFSSARGDGNVAFGLFIGAAAIVLMAWSFLLALRPRVLEPFFGGLDSMYRVHRWAGSLAVVAMFLHTSIEPEIDGGILGAARSLADQAEDLAGTAELMLYVLVGISLIRWFPYRFWRWTHKLLGIPFAFACLHFFTAEKPYANGSAWGWYFGIVMVTGLVAYVARVVGRDMVTQGVRHRIRGVVQGETTTMLELEPVRRRLNYRAGQFAFVKLQTDGLREPHAFTIASSPKSDVLRFYIRELGDWSAKLRRRSDLVGTEVIVEGPYGEFQPLPKDSRPTVWIAGGVGITPFLAALDGMEPAPAEVRPHLIYAVRSAQDATAIEALHAAVGDGRLTLTIQESSTDGRLTPARLRELFPSGLRGAHVAMCGPSGLIAQMATAARRLGASHVETEDFDIRQGFGPDLSVDVDRALQRVRGVPAGHVDGSASTQVSEAG